MRKKRGIAAVVLAAVAAPLFAMPAQAASAGTSCPDCGDLPAWLMGLLAVVGVLLAMAILWLPQRIARNVRSRRKAWLIVLGGWVILTIAFVVGVRALVLVLGGS